MNFKSVFCILLMTLGLINQVLAQSCNLISSITLTAPQTQSTVVNTVVGYLPNSSNIISDTSKWHYIVLTKSGTLGSFYFDGILVTSSNFDNNPYIWNSLLLGATQGCVSCNPVANFNGLIDEVRVSNVSRTAESVALAFSSNIPFVVDANTIGLFHLDNLSGNTVINSNGGTAAVFGSPAINEGKYGKAISFDGLHDYIRWSNSIPVNNMTVEFWFKSSDQEASVAMLEYAYNTGIYLANSKVTNPTNWSTGETTASITVNPSKLPYVWVNNGQCTDTIFFNSKSATIYDTLTVKKNIYDTVIVPKTVTKYDTVTITNNVTKYDTVKVTKFDTVTVKNNVYDTVIVNKYDTITFTNNITKYDTLKVTKFDTITVKNNVYDTVTITNNVTKYDTVIVNKYDTITVTNNVTKYDTITLTDTVSILKITFKLTTGIQANQMASMSLYPNPTTDVLHIEIGDAKALDGYRYRILDALGKEVYNELVKNTITEIPLKTLGAAGMYQFEVLDQKNVRIQANKIVLQ